jgi:large subunit ribosomal protein L20
MNAALGELGVKYSVFIHTLKVKQIELDRKVLSQIAVEYPAAFASLVKQVTAKA